MTAPFEGPPTAPGSALGSGLLAAPGSTSVGGDVVRFGTAVVLAVGLGLLQVFLVPRRLDLATFGEYRRFLVFVAYLGLLHLGVADGAFVRWAGQAPAVIHQEWRRVATWLFAMHGAVLLVACVTAVSVGGALSRTYLIALAAAALCVNATAFVGFVLQALRDFRGAGSVALVPPAVFVTAVLVLPVRSLPAVLAAWVVSYGLAAIVGGIRVVRLGSRPPPASEPAPLRPPLEFASLLRLGSPVLGASLAAGLSQFGDRVMVSLTVPVTTFALYGFASSAMVAASAATNVLSRVGLAHAAWRAGAERARFLGGMYSLISVAFGIALAGVPLFEHVVALALPAYAGALPIVRALVAGSLFWMAIHVVLVGTLQTYGFVRMQFALELSGTATVAVAVGVSLAAHVPLRGIAAVAAAAAAVTWSMGVVLVGRVVPDARSLGSRRFVAIGASQLLALAIALAIPAGWLARTLVYAVLSSFPTTLAGRAALAHVRC